MRTQSIQVTFRSKDKIRAVFLVMTILTCGFGAIPWIIYEIVTAGRN